MIISPEFVRENQRLHESVADYGGYGSRNAEQVFGLLSLFRPKSVLDFGCGKATLGHAVKTLCSRRYELPPGPLASRDRRLHFSTSAEFPESWVDYDPAIPGKDTFPHKVFDMVVATDVLEHVEPELLDGVLETIRGITGKAFYCTIGLAPSTRRLSDGRDAHLIIEPPKFWIGKLLKAGEFEHVEILASRSKTILTLLAL